MCPTAFAVLCFHFRLIPGRFLLLFWFLLWHIHHFEMSCLISMSLHVYKFFFWCQFSLSLHHSQVRYKEWLQSFCKDLLCVPRCGSFQKSFRVPLSECVFCGACIEHSVHISFDKSIWFMMSGIDINSAYICPDDLSIIINRVLKAPIIINRLMLFCVWCMYV